MSSISPTFIPYLNVYEDIFLYKSAKKAPTDVIKRHIISHEELAELLEKYHFGLPYYIPILILFHTGMRIGELCGLTWNDVDFAKKVIMLNHQMVCIYRKGYFFSTLKTESSNRHILIDDFLTGELRRWKERQAENENSAGDSYVHTYKNADNKIIQQSKGLGEIDAERVFHVCTRVGGRIILKTHLERTLQRENLNAHSFRHTHATTLIENGATPKGVATYLVYLLMRSPKKFFQSLHC